MERGVPVVAVRTSTHAFNFPKNSKWFKYSFNANKESGWEKGYGRQVLGETWISHHGRHKREGTRSKVEQANANHPVLKGVGEIFGDTDVYGASPTGYPSGRSELSADRPTWRSHHEDFDRAGTAGASRRDFLEPAR